MPRTTVDIAAAVFENKCDLRRVIGAITTNVWSG
jgi:hypothetical protein